MNGINLTVSIDRDSPPELIEALKAIIKLGNPAIETETDLTQIKTVNRQDLIAYLVTTMSPDDASAKQKAKTKARTAYPELLKYFQGSPHRQLKSILDIRCPNCRKAPGKCHCAHMHTYWDSQLRWNPAAVWEVGIESLTRLTATDLNFLRTSHHEAIVGWIEHIKSQG